MEKVWKKARKKPVIIEYREPIPNMKGPSETSRQSVSDGNSQQEGEEMRYTEEQKLRLQECFANRGLMSNVKRLDEDVQKTVKTHFDGCPACQEWATKHKIDWRK